MTTPAAILELPMYLAGVSDQVADWLSQAGIPVVRLDEESSLSPASIQSSSGQEHKAAIRCLLFDSRDPWSRQVVRGYSSPGCCQIDIAAWVNKIQNPLTLFKKNQIPAPPARLDFLERLKRAIESEGGLWARVADFPFPYQGVVCLDEDRTGADLPLDVESSGPHALDAIQERYIAGLPSTISISDLSGLADLPPVTGLESRGLPLLWRTKPEEFAAWWQERIQIEFKLWQSPTHYHVECRNVDTSFCPVLEIWRGSHLASVPLRSETLVIRKEGLVFQQQPARHPAGFTAGWPDTSLEAIGTRLSA
jgi:hypothetical protein